MQIQSALSEVHPSKECRFRKTKGRRVRRTMFARPCASKPGYRGTRNVKKWIVFPGGRESTVTAARTEPLNLSN